MINEEIEISPDPKLLSKQFAEISIIEEKAITPQPESTQTSEPFFATEKTQGAIEMVGHKGTVWFLFFSPFSLINIFSQDTSSWLIDEDDEAENDEEGG